MRLAIKEAEKSAERLKCGAVIAKEGRVIASACNSQRESNDASGHAEINAIRKAGKRLNNKNLNDCEIYCTCEPYVMCLSALVFAKIKRIVCGSSLREVSPKCGINIEMDSFMKRIPREISVVNNFMKEECDKLS